MAPYIGSEPTPDIDSIPDSPKKTSYLLEPNWVNIAFFSVVHCLGFYGLFLAATSAKWPTLFWTWVLNELTCLGLTAGAHRLWSHRSYKARWPVQLFLMLCFTMGHQKSIYKWVRDHRIHHKYTDTDGDPHNIRRGFFFAHIGWILSKKLPYTIEKGKLEDMSDLKANPIVMFQHNHYYKILPFVSWILPTIVPMYAWNESFVNSFCLATMFRYIWSLHLTCLINSVAHSWGNRPYDKSICAVNNNYIFLPTLGEGWHNYHHVFPWDYRSVELACTKFNVTTVFIDLMAKIGLVSDRKVAPQHLVEKRMVRTGDRDPDYVVELPKSKVRLIDEVEEAGNVLFKTD
nr:acyl-CoA Delta(11) desaturase-like [Halyomorpha halys]